MSRLAMLWARVSNSLWFIPALITIASAGLAALTIWIDGRELLGQGSFLFAVGAEGARGILTTIAGSIITVTGVLFSITVVVLQLASSQFTPRILRSFTEDRATQVVLGVFIGTFAFSLLVLRTVRDSADSYDQFIPWLSVTVALGLALVSIGFLIYYINHIARSIQAEVILQRVTHDALEIAQALFPETLGEPAEEEDPVPTALPAGGSADLRAQRGGYLQAVDEAAVLDLAEEHDLLVQMEMRVGDFVLEEDVLARAWPAGIDAQVRDRLRAAFRVGSERTRHQDVQRGLVELTDVGVRALSPGINDPTTAIVCIDRVTEVLALLAERRFPAAARKGRDGRVRVVARYPSFDELVRMPYQQLRHFGAGIPAVAVRLAESLTRLLARAPAERRGPLREELDELLASARREIGSAADLARVEAAARVRSAG